MSPSDLRALVGRVTDALGPDAPPSVVEQVVRAVVDSRGRQSEAVPPSGRAVGAGPITGRIIVTAYGCDRPGILAAIASELRDLGINVLDVSQKILQGYFTLILLADITGSGTTVGQAQENLSRHGSELGVRILVQHEELFQALRIG